MKGFILKPHEAQALAAGKPVVIWRPVKEVVTPIEELGDEEYDGPQQFFVEGGKLRTPSRWGSHEVATPFPVGVPLFGKETWGLIKESDVLISACMKEPEEGFALAYRCDRTDLPKGCWRSAAQMPQWASRITLTLSDVNVRRPCDVTGEEACDMLTEECRAKAPYMETKGVLADWHIRAFRKQFSLHHKTDWSLYHFTALATPA